MILALRLLLALLSLTPPPRVTRRRIAAHRDAIVEAAVDGEQQHGIPPGVLLVVGFLETHLGTDAGEGGNWGAPRDARHRHTAGTPDNAARILARGFSICGTWIGAVHFYRCGRCTCPHLVGYEAPYAIRLVERVHERAGIEAPEHLRAR